MIDYADTAIKQLRKLDEPTAHMDQRITSLENPRSTGKALTGPLGDLWRYQVGDYRVICDIQDDTFCVLVVQVGNRRDVYR